MGVIDQVFPSTKHETHLVVQQYGDMHYFSYVGFIYKLRPGVSEFRKYMPHDLLFLFVLTAHNSQLTTGKNEKKERKKERKKEKKHEAHLVVQQ